MLTSFDKIIWIGLKSTATRRIKMAQRLKEIDLRDKHGDEPIWSEANTGNIIPHGYDPSFRKKKKQIPVSRSELGCYASHFKVWNEIVEHGYELTLILEDDAEFLPGFKKVLSTWETLPEFDYLNFGANTFTISPASTKSIIDFDPPLFTGYGFWLTHAYCITLDCAKVLVKEMAIQHTGLDHQMVEVQPKLKCLAFMPMIVRQLERSQTNPSTIVHTVK